MNGHEIIHVSTLNAMSRLSLAVNS